MTRAWEENEEVVERFRAWLEQTGREIDDLDATGADDRPDASVRDEPFVEVGLRQLVEAFTAMRHELKLQTKSTRGLDETVHSALQGLEAAMNRFQSVQAREQEAAEGAARPLVEMLAGLDEALHRGARAFEAAQRQMTQAAPDELGRALDEAFRRQPWWRRLLMRRWHEFLRRRATETLARCNDREFARVMQGYRLIVTRMQRALAEQFVQRMECLGRRVDPAEMTVVELVDDPEADPETVVEEVRPGYLWRGKVIRFAEVRAVASRAASVASPDAAEPPGAPPLGKAPPEIKNDPEPRE